MMSDSVIIFSRQWPVTSAIAALIEPLCTCPVISVYTLQSLEVHLIKHRRNVVILGFNPHEHINALHYLHPLLKGQKIIFISKDFYWTDYVLPCFWGLEGVGLYTLDDFRSCSRRASILKHGVLVSRNQKFLYENTNAVSSINAEPGMISLSEINRWLEQQQTHAGLTRREIDLLWMLSDGERPEMDSQKLTLFKKRGLEKIGMSLHLKNLYCGIKVRPELQASLPQENRRDELL